MVRWSDFQFTMKIFTINTILQNISIDSYFSITSFKSEFWQAAEFKKYNDGWLFAYLMINGFCRI